MLRVDKSLQHYDAHDVNALLTLLGLEEYISLLNEKKSQG